MRQFDAEYNLTQDQFEETIRQFNKQFRLEEERVRADIKRVLAEGKLATVMQGIRKGELDLRKREVQNEKDYREAQLDHDADVLSAEITQRNLDRSHDFKKHEDVLNLENIKFDDFVKNRDKEWAFTSKQVSKEFGLEEDKFEIMRFQVEQDVLMKRGDIESSVRRWAEEFDIDPVVAANAIDEARVRQQASLDQVIATADLTQEQANKLKSEYAAFQKAEARRDDIWALGNNENFNWNNPAHVNEITGLMMLVNNSSGAFEFEEDDGFWDSVGDYTGNLFGNITDNIITNQLKKWGLPLT